MSVIIKGMEMPENCICCDLSHEDGWCPAKQDYIDRYSFENCPLVPVPPHGRLIDAEALKMRLVWAKETAEWAVPALRGVLVLVDEMPAIIEAEEGCE